MSRSPLLAATHETGKIPALQAALPIAAPTTHFGRMGQATLHAMLLTMLFLSVVGLRCTWGLRSNTGKMLALFTGRGWAMAIGICLRTLPNQKWCIWQGLRAKNLIYNKRVQGCVEFRGHRAMENSTLHCPADFPTLPAASFSTPAWGAVACLFAVLRFGSSRSI